MADDDDEVFVPSVEQGDGVVVGLGIFSSETIAMNVLKDFLKRTEQMDLVSSELTKWQLDMIGQDGSTLLLRMANRLCPVCERTTFWVDLVSFNALCYGTSCGAWIEDNIHEDEIIDCGWPPLRYLHQSRSVKDAMYELGKIGARLKAAGEAASALADQAYEDEFGDPKNRTERIMRQFGQSALGDSLHDDDDEIEMSDDESEEIE